MAAREVAEKKMSSSQYVPLMRFIAGAAFAARELTKRVLGHRASPSRRDATARNVPRDADDATALEKVDP